MPRLAQITVKSRSRRTITPSAALPTRTLGAHPGQPLRQVQVLLHLDCLALQHLLLLELVYLGGHHPVSITPTRESSSALGAPPARCSSSGTFCSVGGAAIHRSKA